ncbi:hypothetical protein T484DRAFT_3293282 [Baffinella frigidus]|nr:hypothetical protein T484DRAFT_3293282 [Cryptophyta sp. CCMP2293]
MHPLHKRGGASVAHASRGALPESDPRVPELGLRRQLRKGGHEPAPRGVRARGGCVQMPGVRRAPSPEGHGRARGGDPSRFGGEASAERVGSERCAGGECRGAGEREASRVVDADVVGVQLAGRRLGGQCPPSVRDARLRGGGETLNPKLQTLNPKP